jgi:hypothetical protein
MRQGDISYGACSVSVEYGFPRCPVIDSFPDPSGGRSAVNRVSVETGYGDVRYAAAHMSRPEGPPMKSLCRYLWIGIFSLNLIVRKAMKPNKEHEANHDPRRSTPIMHFFSFVVPHFVIPEFLNSWIYPSCLLLSYVGI